MELAETAEAVLLRQEVDMKLPDFRPRHALARGKKRKRDGAPPTEVRPSLAELQTAVKAAAAAATLADEVALADEARAGRAVRRRDALMPPVD